MFFPDAWLDELRARSELVELVSGYVSLKQKGRRWWGLCPFHGEKSPSFSVDAENQLYYCFGCHAGGTAIQFAMAIERMDFQEAVLLLAERAHMDLPPQQDSSHAQPRVDKQRLFEAMSTAARIYHETLFAPEGVEALAYLRSRGVGDGAIRGFGLGAAPQSWDAISMRMMEEGFSREELVQVGLSSVKGERMYDLFRGRLMFPILASRGKVIGFGGRILQDGQPKYLNTGDTPLFNKRRNLYGLHRVKRNLERLWLTEGYMDVIAVSQSGIEGAVATLGTAITPEQSKLMKRFAPRVTVCYDSDEAGQNATMKALDLLDEAGVDASVCLLPEGYKDPDDFLRANGRDAFLSLKTLDSLMYRLHRAEHGLDLAAQEDRTAYAIAAAGILRNVKEPVIVEEHIRSLSVKTGFSTEVLWQQIGKLPSQGKNENTRGIPRYNRLDSIRIQPEHEKAADQILSLLFHGRIDPGEWIRVEDFPGESRQELARRLLNAPGDRREIVSWAEKLEGAKHEEVFTLLSMEVTCDDAHLSRMVKECVMRMKRPKIMKEIEALEAQRAELAADDLEQFVLGNRIMDLERELRRLDTGRKE